MKMTIGICGYPGSGKSTVFSALSPGSSSSRGGISYGNIKVPDTRVDRLTEIFSPRKTTYAEITFMDVGGQGGRSGGAFPPEVLQAMRNATVLVHVARAFENPYLTESADPMRDVSNFEEELILMDMTLLDKRKERFRKENRKGGEVSVNNRCLEWLEDGKALRSLDISAEELRTLTGIQLLSLRPLITLYNVSEDDWEDSPLRQLNEPSSLAVCGQIEADIAAMDADEQAEFLEEMGMGEPARNEFIRTAYASLNLISFLTAGPDECRAWTIRRGDSAPVAAGAIHSDIQRGFIRAEVYQLAELEELGSEAALKSAGRLRVEGKTYTVQDGDVINFRFNV